MRQRALVRISEAALKEVLGIRPDLDIYQVEFDRLTGSASILLGGEGLPQCRECEEPRYVALEQVTQQ